MQIFYAAHIIGANFLSFISDCEAATPATVLRLQYAGQPYASEEIGSAPKSTCLNHLSLAHEKSLQFTSGFFKLIEIHKVGEDLSHL